MYKLSELCSDIAVINGFNHKYHCLIKNKMTLLAIIKGYKVGDVKFIEELNVKYVNKILKYIRNFFNSNNYHPTFDIHLYEYKSKFYISKFMEMVDDIYLYDKTFYTDEGALIIIKNIHDILNNLVNDKRNISLNKMDNDDKTIAKLSFDMVENIKIKYKGKYYYYFDYFIAKYPNRVDCFTKKELMNRLKYTTYNLMKPHLFKKEL